MSYMGVLKVVSVWCDSLHDCGLIIWGFICLGIIALILVCFYYSFYWVELNYGFIQINHVNWLKSHF